MELEYLMVNVIKSRFNFLLIVSSALLVFILFIITVIYKLAVGDKKRFFVWCSAGVVAVSEGLFLMQSPSVLISVGVPFLVISFGEILFFKCLLLLFNEKKIVVSESEKNLIEELDEKIEREKDDGVDYFFDNPFIKRAKSAAERVGETENISVKPIKKAEEKPQRNKRGAVNFSHVQTVIDLLRGCPLSATDRKKVEELSVAIKEEENDESGYNERLNGALETLLKLTSKYKTQ